MLSPTVSLVLRPNAARPTIRDSFITLYPCFAPRCRAVDTPSVTLVAIDDLGVDGMITTAARPGAIATAIVGRHDRADLCLERHEDLGLRHLALIVEPAASWARGSADVTYRLLDLRTGTGFTGEQGQPLVAVRCGGTAFFRCAGYTLLALATGDPTDWPDDPLDAWEMIPERVMLGERAAPERRAPRGRCDGNVTLVTRLRPVRAPVAAEDPVATIELGGRRLGVDAVALADGILIGRYERCDASSWLDDETVSRAHLLVLSVDGAPHAIDLASTWGTRVAGASVRAAPLGDDVRLEIGAATTARWCTVRGRG